MPARSRLCVRFAPNRLGRHVDQQKIVVGAACDEVEPMFHQCIAKRFGIGNHIRGVLLEARIESLFGRHGEAAVVWL